MQLDLGRLLDDALDGDLNVVVERIKLLTNETFLAEVGRKDQPAGLFSKAGLGDERVLAIVSARIISKMWKNKKPQFSIRLYKPLF